MLHILKLVHISIGSGNADRDSFSRWRDRQYFGPRRWFQNPREESQWEKESGECLTND